VIGSLVVRPERPPLGVDERALLADVIAAPDADGPRLVYADWLQHGGDRDAARGELIVVQCALATITEPLEHNRLKARDFELVERHGNRWCAGVGIGEVRNNWHRHAWAADFERGFITTVQMPTSAFPSVATQLFAVEPVREVVLVGWYGTPPRRLHESIYLRRLRSLTLRQTHLDDDALVSLLTSPMLAVERLAIDGQPIGPRTLAALGALKLRELSLRDAHLRVDQLLALISSPVATDLEVLALDRNPFGESGAVGLVRSHTLRRLRNLSLTGVELGAIRERLVERFGSAVECDVAGPP
jgi:uncharacterized protein (TIGR02996 family)